MHLRVLRVLVEEVVKPLYIISVWHSGELSSDWKTYSPFLKRKKGKFQELQASEYQICVWQDLSGNYAKAHGKQKIDWWWPTCLHQRQIMPHKLDVIQGCITAFVENENVTDVICLYLFNVFDTVPHNVLASKMKRNWFVGRMTLLKMNELDDFIYRVCMQHIQVSGIRSSQKRFRKGMVQLDQPDLFPQQGHLFIGWGRNCVAVIYLDFSKDFEAFSFSILLEN